MIETHRRLYNACLSQRKEAYETEQRSIKYTEQSAWYKSQRGENAYFARLNFSSAQSTMRRLDKAFRAFFRRVKTGGKPGYPRFKARGRFDSIEFPSHGDGIRLKENRLRVQHVGVVKVKLHRAHEGNIKTLSLKNEAGKWYLILSCDLGEVATRSSTNPSIGIDLGLESFLVTSEGEKVANPRFLKDRLPALRRVQRGVSRKKLRGKNRKKSVNRLRVLHAKIANCRKDFHHKLALDLTQRFGLIAVERLSVKKMLGNRWLARSISDVGWSSFLIILKHKAEEAGVQIQEVNPAWTSQTCSSCGARVSKKLSDRIHNCSCGLKVHRDTNAAINILGLGLASGTERVALAPVSQEAVCFS